MLRSMTAFASARGSGEGHCWSWELRGVNGKGLDLRLRVPDWIEGLEAALRARLAAALARGNVTVSLRVEREEGAGTLSINRRRLEEVLSALATIEARARARGMVLAPASAAEVMDARGVMDSAAQEVDGVALGRLLLADLEPVLQSFLEMRAAEGAALERVLSARLDEIARLIQAASEAAEARGPEIERSFRSSVARVLDAAEGLDPTRIAQELALLAVRADVTEEIDRLRAHVAAARDLLAAGSPVGRKLDFLMQEFNREANTLCSKAQNTRLTAIGLELKTVIDQMREQVQNVE